MARLTKIGFFLAWLRDHCVAAGTPYDEDAQGFQRWLPDQWPAPRMA
jgi:hypothetical protein